MKSLAKLLKTHASNLIQERSVALASHFRGYSMSSNSLSEEMRKDNLCCLKVSADAAVMHLLFLFNQPP
jgi:hypothetical protein